MKKEYFILIALLAFGFASAQTKMSISGIADNRNDKDKKEISKPKKKSSKDKSKKVITKKDAKTEEKNVTARKFKKYYINSSGQKTYVD